ncbi:MAG: acyl-CoA thioesterase [Firmicutes bacterium]|nr:acyl-CoA thioesterase [Bacillota bacterium]
MKEYITNYRPIYADTDAMGIVYHANYLRLFELGRTEMLREIGFTYKNMEETDQVMLPLAEIGIKYKKPAYYDDLLEIRTSIAELKNASVTLGYEIYNEDGELIVTGMTKHAITDESMKPVALKKKSKGMYDALMNAMKE